MIQDEELISNISYTNSDFRTIFPQLLDTAKKLSNKWDPSLSNESDPGNILLKEAAIIGDKNNYHIDKNVLECFPLSATQQSSARQLYDLVGYNMHWYKSAYSTIQLTLLKSIDNIINENSDAGLSFSQITLKPGRQIADSTGEYVYSLLEPISLNKARELKSVSAIQGTIEPYEINGNSNITIDNLDENLRLYFPQNFIAENGIFVYDKGSIVENVGYHNDVNENNTVNAQNNICYWGLVNNLTQYPANSKVFKFGLDLDSDKCYIEFPSEVITLIKDGLNIYYTITKGNEGNVKASVLNSFINDIIINGENENVSVTQYIKVSNLASIGGRDPETLKDAYKNYKRTIGTYDTLVSRRDYNNAIYNLKQDNNTNLNLISNGFVTDRTSDINYSQSVIITKGSSDYSKNYVAQNDGGDILNSYDVILYLLKQPTSMLTIEDYNISFIPDTSAETLLTIQDRLDEFKSVQHNLNYISEIPSPITTPDFDITNVIALNGNITTYYKVTKEEARQIESNVTKALIENYNSRELTFGEQIYYDDIINIIKTADDRIRNVSLNIPNYEPYLQNIQGVKSSLYSSVNTDKNNEILAKSILAGKVQLFNFLEDFQVDFNQNENSEYSNISTLTAENNITLSANTFKQLSQNDIIQIVTPSLYVSDTYSATVRYSFRSTNVSSIQTGTPYKLTTGDTLKVIYANQNGTLVSELIPKNTLIRPQGFTLISNDNTGWDDNYAYQNILSAGQSIEVLNLSTGTINGANTYYYIVTNHIEKENNKDYYTLTLNETDDYILQENEYFIYTSQDLNGIIVLGSGTSLKLDSESSQTSIELKSLVLNLEDIYNTSYEDIYNENENSNWNLLGENLSRVDNDVVTLTQGDYILSTEALNLESTLSDDIQSDSIWYKFNGDANFTTIRKIAGQSDYTIKLRSTMILNANAYTAQKLFDNQKLYIDDEVSPIAEAGKYILFNYPIVMTGGYKTNVQILNEDTGIYESLLGCLVYTENNANPSREGGVISMNATTTFDYTFNQTVSLTSTDLYNGNNPTGVVYYLIPINATISPQNSAPATLEVSITGTNAKVASFHDYLVKLANSEDPDNSITYTNAQNPISDILVIICPDSAGANNLKFEFTNTTDDSKVEIGYISRVHNLNLDEVDMEKVANNTYYKYSLLEDSNYVHVISKLVSLPGASNLDWTYRVPNTNKVIQPLSGEAYFNINHVYNQYTIPKIDLNKTSIKVASTEIT